MAQLLYGVDLDDLLATVDDLAACGTELAGLLAEVARRVAALHVTWSGRAASAHTDAQADWEAGFRAMHDGLAAMRAAARTAHGNYAGAVGANVRMWEQVR
jgi:WXG100 family type VII secretion target